MLHVIIAYIHDCTCMWSQLRLPARACFCFSDLHAAVESGSERPQRAHRLDPEDDLQHGSLQQRHRAPAAAPGQSVQAHHEGVSRSRLALMSIVARPNAFVVAAASQSGLFNIVHAHICTYKYT